MTESKYTHILTIVDRSGSMMSVRNDMVGGLNAFFKSQAEEEGKCLVDYVQFDTTVEHVYSDKSIGEAEAFLEPRGMTALHDAIGISVNKLSQRIERMAKVSRPDNVIVVVVTDGFENSSKEWSLSAVKQLIEQQEKNDWTFTFLGANMDAVNVGTAMGFKGEHSLTYSTNKIGATSAVLSENIKRTRAGDKTGYTTDERFAAVDGK